MLGSAQNQLQDFLHVVRKRRWQILLPAVFVTTLGGAFAVIVPKKYKLTTRIEISEQRLEPDSQYRNPQEMAVKRELPNVREHIENDVRVKEVIERNQGLWPEYAAASEDERQRVVRTIVEKNLKASAIDNKKGTGSTFIDIEYKDSDPARGVSFLKDLSISWLEDVRERQRDQLRGEREVLQTLAAEAQKKFEELNSQLFRQAEELKLDPNQLEHQESRFRDEPRDWHFKTLEEKKTEREALDGRLSAAQSELVIAEKRYEEEPEEITDWVPVEGADHAKKIETLQEKKAKIEEVLERLLPDNSQHKKLTRDVADIDEEIQDLLDGESGDSEEELSKPNPLKQEYLRAKIAAQDLVKTLTAQIAYSQQEVDQLEEETRVRTQQYRDLQELQNEVGLAREAANTQHTLLQAKEWSIQQLENSPTPWTIARVPMVSTATVIPNPWMIGAFAGAAGLALGLLLAMAGEYARNCYRSVADLASVMNVPVLGAIETIVTRREQRRAQAQHALVGLSTAMIVGGVGWVTWMWSSAPERLPLEVQRAIERFRDVLM